jgi:hypothetical protein
MRSARLLITGRTTAATSLVSNLAHASRLQAGEGDLLLLKGHAADGNYGMGAVHKSPQVATDEESEVGGPPGGSKQAQEGLRLLLTVDDTAACACGHEHGGEAEAEHRPDATLLVASGRK